MDVQETYDEPPSSNKKLPSKNTGDNNERTLDAVGLLYCTMPKQWSIIQGFYCASLLRNSHGNRCLDFLEVNRKIT